MSVRVRLLRVSGAGPSEMTARNETGQKLTRRPPGSCWARWRETAAFSNPRWGMDGWNGDVANR